MIKPSCLLDLKERIKKSTMMTDRIIQKGNVTFDDISELPGIGDSKVHSLAKKPSRYKKMALKL